MIYLVLLSLIALPLAAMEPVQFRMQDEEPNEKQPLLAPQPVVMNENEKQEHSPSILFDESRRYYNHESYKKVRCEAIKRCTCDTLCAGLCTGCIMYAFGISCGGCISACMGSTKGIIIRRAGGLLIEFGTGCGASGFLLMSLIMGGGTACDNRIKLADIPENLKWDGRLEILLDLLEAADPQKVIWVDKKHLQNLLIIASLKSINQDCALPFFRKLFTCSYHKEKKIHTSVINRLQHDMIRILLADKFHNEFHLSKDLIKHLFKFIDFSNINKETYITEKEFLYLLRGVSHYIENDPIPPIAHRYANTCRLAQHGWVSLTQNEQHPIRSEMKYFDSHALPEKAKKWYVADEGPIMYLPYDLELAKYYRFEKDPAYEAEYAHPSNGQISALLIERRKYAK